MERVVSPEERMRRAEEIYYRRRSQGVRVSTNSVNVGKSAKLSLTQKMIIQILVCVVIYSTLWVLKGYNNVFSENIINQTRSVLSYDVNFPKLYNQCVEYFSNNFNNIIKINDNDANNVESDDVINKNQNESIDEIGTNQENLGEENIQAGENIQTDDNSNGEENIQSNENNSDVNNTEQTDEITQNEKIVDEGVEDSAENQKNDISQSAINDGTQKAKLDSENKQQMEEDAEYIKQNYSLTHPIQGTITSRFGDREETEIISAFHQGIDIAAVTGTAIQASMEGTVVAASYAGDYGNHIKIQNGEVLTVYAHCSELEVEVGSYIEQGQEIGKVGATGKVTGPHLHFEIRREGRYVNPEMILTF